jgi:hypothetical protein
MLVDDRQTVGFHHLAITRMQEVRRFLRKDVMQASPDYFVARNAKEIFGRAIDEHEFFVARIFDGDDGGNVLDDRVKELARAPDLGRRRLALRDLAEMLARNEKAHEPKRNEQAEAQTGALRSDGMHERRRRHVDGEGAHEIVDTPLRPGLQLVVAVDAALLAREGWIDRPEHHLTVGGQELGLRFWIGLRGESLDRLRHVGIGRRRRDFPAGTADPAQAEDVVGPTLRIECVERETSREPGRSFQIATGSRNNW